MEAFARLSLSEKYTKPLTRTKRRTVPRKRSSDSADDSTVSTCATSLNSSFYSLQSTVSSKKSVRFDFDTNDQVREEVIEPEVVLAAEEIEAMWWNAKDYRFFRKYCHKLAEAAQKSKYFPEFHKLYEACAANETDRLSGMTKICNTGVRGLELVIYPALTSDRKTATLGVLKAQEKVALESNMSQKKKEDVIAATSRFLSRQARLLARVYGNGDARVAKEAYARPWNEK